MQNINYLLIFILVSYHVVLLIIISSFSVLSRCGIHSLPSILVMNRTSMVKYHGSKTLLSLVRFYERNTGNFLLYFTLFNKDVEDDLFAGTCVRARSSSFSLIKLKIVLLDSTIEGTL